MCESSRSDWPDERCNGFSAGKKLLSADRFVYEICRSVYAEKALNGGDRSGRRDLWLRPQRTGLGGTTRAQTQIKWSECSGDASTASAEACPWTSVDAVAWR